MSDQLDPLASEAHQWRLAYLASTPDRKTTMTLGEHHAQICESECKAAIAVFLEIFTKPYEGDPRWLLSMFWGGVAFPLLDSIARYDAAQFAEKQAKLLPEVGDASP